jgi:hypothetical protein
LRHARPQTWKARELLEERFDGLGMTHSG